MSIDANLMAYILNSVLSFHPYLKLLASSLKISAESPPKIKVYFHVK
jgi:hypothetical protein